jgi:hypothetical protein
MSISVATPASLRRASRQGACPNFSGVDPADLFEHVAGHIEAGADEVIFSFPFADPAGISAVSEAFGLGRH